MTMATLKIVFWALAFVFFVVCEVATGTALVSIWLAIAALIAMFCAIAKLSFLTQCIVFVVSSRTSQLQQITSLMWEKLQ
ncbi:hypothetical protein [Ruminococcus bicirculans (ex Wegman et al. 2014)]|uniref:NfeD family protein n=1 Tax=Ruminococcus bicirculans (ex Wegman et al. 2014) TaxID=1160721 RepID=UPI00307D823D